MNKDQLASVAQAMVAKGKGLLAADESSGTIKRRFDAIGVAGRVETPQRFDAQPPSLLVLSEKRQVLRQQQIDLPLVVHFTK